MSIHRNVSFEEALNKVESLPESQQEELIEIIQQRLAQYRQEVFTGNQETREEFPKGDAANGIAHDLMKELYCSSPKTWAEKR